MKDTNQLFIFAEDRDFFLDCLPIQIDFDSLFDFRDPLVKRKEFNSLRDGIYKKLASRYGEKCGLHLDGCDEETGFAVDHVIPLKTNVLNKKLRNMKGVDGKKVPAESYGSNNIENLVIACNACNNKKKHLILSKEELKRVLMRNT